MTDRSKPPSSSDRCISMDTLGKLLEQSRKLNRNNAPQSLEWKLLPNASLHIARDENSAEKLIKLTLVLISDQGGSKQIVDMGTLTTPPLEFVHDDIFSCLVLLDRITFPRDGMGDPRNFFALLHEMGHAVDFAKQRAKDPTQIIHALNVAQNIRKGGTNTASECATLLSFERNAWAEAIRITKSLKERYGVDMFALFKDRKDFMGWFRALSLRAYEHNVEQAGGQAYTHSDLVMEWAFQALQENTLLPRDFADINRWFDASAGHHR